jgi:hypothetical protein
MSTNTAQLLAEIPLFSTMDDEERRQLRAIMKERSFQPGQVVMATSDPEASFLFQFLTMAVSLEAIFLSIFVLISQNRQAAKDRIKADLDYRVNVKTELELSAMAEHIRDIEQKLHHIHHDVLQASGGKEGA